MSFVYLQIVPEAFEQILEYLYSGVLAFSV